MRTSAIIAILTLALCSATAHANPFAKPKSAEAQKHLKEGNRRLELRQYDQAIKSYNAGYLSSGLPIFLYNLGLASRKKGDFKAAVEYYEHFLRRARNARPGAKEGIRKIIDQLRVDLKRREGEKAKPKPDKPKSDKPPIVSVTKPVSSAPWYSDKVGWGISAGALIATGVSIGLLLNASGLRSDAETETSATKRDELRASADTRETWGIVLGITGVVGLGVGIIKLIITPRKRAGDSPRVDVALGPNWVGLRGSF